MSAAGASSLRIAVIGGGPAGSFFALHALRFAGLAQRDVSITIYEGKDFRQPGPSGCNMCAGIIPTSVLSRFRDLDLTIPQELILSRVSTYSLHTPSCTLSAMQPGAQAEIITVYRGAGPKRGCPPGLVGFDQLLLDEAVSRGAVLRRAPAQVVRRGRPMEVVSDGECGSYDLVVLATGVNSGSLTLEGFSYGAPVTGTMCQTELYLGQDEVQRRLGSSVHIFLPPDEIAAYGILIPKGACVTVSLLRARHHMRSLRQFLALDEVKAVLGDDVERVCGCLPKVAVGPARGFVDDGFVAVGDASVTRLYKNGIGSALATSERAAWTALNVGCGKRDFGLHYVPLCRGIGLDNQIGRLLFLEVPLLKRFGAMSEAHCRLAAGPSRSPSASDLQARVLWGMFTGANSYRDLLRMATSPRLLGRLALALGASVLAHKAAAPRSS